MDKCDTSDHEKHLCRLYGEGLHKNEPDQYAHLVKNPQFVCKSCGRVASAKENLCEPVPLGTWED
ncbi:MAG: hypothetical protein ACYTET_03035 [Planctomycetota bacterium]|jgi:hypothetical protein